MEETGRDVIPLTFVLPVSVAIAKVSADFRLQDILVLDAPEFRPQEIVRRFWQGWQHYGRPTFVTFNGRTYDLPVMEMAAFRFGISLPAWFNVDSRSFEQCRNRYNQESHLDLQELLTNYGSFRLSGGLNLLANLITKPGKSGIDGSQVQSLYDEGRADLINNYCRCDVLDTYFVFLRCQLLLGRITAQDEQALTDHVRSWLQQQSSQTPAFAEYLETWDNRTASRLDIMASLGR